MAFVADYPGVKTESLGLDTNLPERQAMEGYVPTFLVEHRVILSIMGNTNIPYLDRCNTVSNSVKFMVSLITDSTERETLWQWFNDEFKKRCDAEQDLTNESRIEIQYDLSCILAGKVMDFVGRHISKPLEIGTE